MAYNFRLCQLLERNIADEAEAREGYYKILDYYESELSDREIQELREIIAEESGYIAAMNTEGIGSVCVALGDSQKFHLFAALRYTQRDLVRRLFGKHL